MSSWIRRYVKRNAIARGIPVSVIEQFGAPLHHAGVLSKSELLEKVESAAASRAEIARVLSLAPARITEMYKGERDLSFEEARRLMKRYNINGDSGRAETRTLVDIAFDSGITMVEEVDLAFGMGGGALDMSPESLGLVPFKSDWLTRLHSGPTDNLRVVRGMGDSMTPTIQDGDVVLVDLSRIRLDDQDRIWAVFWGDLGMIKRVRQTSRGSYLLMSDNSVVAPIEAVDGEMSILGRVIWIGRKI